MLSNFIAKNLKFCGYKAFRKKSALHFHHVYSYAASIIIMVVKEDFAELKHTNLLSYDFRPYASYKIRLNC